MSRSRDLGFSLLIKTSGSRWGARERDKKKKFGPWKAQIKNRAHQKVHPVISPPKKIPIFPNKFINQKRKVIKYNEIKSNKNLLKKNKENKIFIIRFRSQKFQNGHKGIPKIHHKILKCPLEPFLINTKNSSSLKSNLIKNWKSNIFTSGTCSSTFYWLFRAFLKITWENTWQNNPKNFDKH